MTLNAVGAPRVRLDRQSADANTVRDIPNDNLSSSERIASQPTTADRLSRMGTDGNLTNSEPKYSDLIISERRNKIDDANNEYQRTGDPSAYDGVDTFRQHLSPAQQRDYDSYLNEVRNNDDINIRYWDGATQDALTDELVYRGIAAATFGNQDLVRQTVEVAEQYELYEHPDWSSDTSNRNGVAGELSNDDGQFDVYIYPPGSDNPAGQVVASGDIIIDQGELKGIHESADNLVIHEFAHIEQGITESRSIWDHITGQEGDFSYSGKPLPQGFPDESLFFERAASDGFDQLLEDNSLIGDAERRTRLVSEKSGEIYATVTNLFLQQPEALRTADTQLYDLMVEHMGFDPLSAELTDNTDSVTQQLPGTDVNNSPLTQQSAQQSAQHTVQPGDNLSAIAAANQISLSELLAANPQISDPNIIQPGQVINLPLNGTGGDQTPTNVEPVTPTNPIDTNTGSVPASQLSVSDAGLEFITGHEGLRLELYNDPAGHATIGVGHLVHLGPIDGRASEAPFANGITRAEAMDLLRQDVRTAEDAVRQSVTVPLNQNQFDALVSFTFNLGAGNLRNSTLLRRLNQGEYDAVPSELNRWTRGGGQVLPGLVRRRAEEGELFTTPVNGSGDTGPIQPPVGEPPAVTNATLRNGARGSDVITLQQALIDAGFNPGTVDGIFGAQTESAVRAYQSANNLTVDGIVGAETWGSLGVTVNPSSGPAGTSVTTGPENSAADIWVKNSADIDELSPQIAATLDDVVAAWAANGGPTPVITSGNDGVHSRNSLHFVDHAIDLRANNISDRLAAIIAADLQARLGNDYDVIFERFPNNPANDHIHVEYDPD